MIVMAVYDMVYSVDIEVPDGTTEEKAMELAGKYLDEHYDYVASGFGGWSEIDVKEVWLPAETTEEDDREMPLKFVVEYPCEGCYYEFDTLEEARKLYDEIEPSEGEFAYLFKDVITEYGYLDNIGFAYKDWEGEKN